MPITTLDGALAGMKPPVEFTKAVTGTMVSGRPHSLLYLAGNPGAGVAPAVGAKGAALTSYPGKLPFTNPTAGQNTHLARLQAQCTIAGTLVLCDRLWHNNLDTLTGVGTELWIGGTIVSSSVANPSVITLSAATVLSDGDSVTIVGHSGSTPDINGTHIISNVNAGAGTFTIPINVSGGGSGGACYISPPARDRNGQALGVDIMAGAEIAAATGAGTPNLTLKYINSAGEVSKSGAGIIAGIASSIQGSFYQIGLAAGDLGVRGVQSFTLSASWTQGKISIVLYRVLARLELTAANIPNAIDMLTGGFPKMFDNTVPFLIFIPSTTTTSNIVGHMIYSQG